jgi:deoxyribodipyrimidine photo-lyase
MHNRLRMVVASFLCKDLGIDWRRGEAYFATAPQRLRPGRQQRRLAMGQLQRLRRPAVLPHLQPGEPERKFDAQGKFIRRYLPQLAGLADAAITCAVERHPWSGWPPAWTLGKNYPNRIVMHDEARDKTLLRYAVVKKANRQTALASKA